MVVAFMNITSYSYRNSNAEVSLQMESSISSGLISDLVKEANAYKFTDVTVEHRITVLCILQLMEKST